MTTRKADIPLSSRLTAYVTRESGAAELQVSPSTWDEMVDRGLLPKPYLLGPNKDLKRWRWCEVENRIVGDVIGGDQQERELFFRSLSSGKTPERKRAAP
jgi:hypothetical protein